MLWCSADCLGVRAPLESVGAQADQGGAPGEGGERSLRRKVRRRRQCFPRQGGRFHGARLGCRGRSSCSRGGPQRASQHWHCPSCFLPEPKHGVGQTSQASDSTWPTPNVFQPHAGRLSSVPAPVWVARLWPFPGPAGLTCWLVFRSVSWVCGSMCVESPS